MVFTAGRGMQTLHKSQFFKISSPQFHTSFVSKYHHIIHHFVFDEEEEETFLANLTQ